MRFKIESEKYKASKASTLQMRQRYAVRLAAVLIAGTMVAGCNAPRTTVDVESPPLVLPEDAVTSEQSATDTSESTQSDTDTLAQSSSDSSSASATMPFSVVTGVLVATDERQPCQTQGACGPEFSLYSEAFDERVVLTGNIDASYNGLIVTVEGLPVDLEVQVAGNAGAPNILPGLDVKQVEAVSKIAYQPFLVQVSDEFTEKTFGCTILWDRSFSWQVDDEVPQLRVRMSEYNRTGPSGRWVEAWYDGRGGEFIRFLSQPNDLNPCA